MSVDHRRTAFLVAGPGVRFLLADCWAIFSALAADLAAAAIAALCSLLPKEVAFMVPAPVLQNGMNTRHVRSTPYRSWYSKRRDCQDIFGRGEASKGVGDYEGMDR
jgi:hypothetical protein